MIIRAILGIVLSGALSAGALYGAGEYLGIRSASAVDVAAMEPAETEATEPDGGAEEPIFEDRLTLPYADGDAGRWLAEVLEGQGPYEVTRSESGEVVDVAALSRRAAANDGVTADCDSSHVAFHCLLTVEETGAQYGFGLQNTADGGYEIPFGDVHRTSGT